MRGDGCVRVAAAHEHGPSPSRCMLHRRLPSHAPVLRSRTSLPSLSLSTLSLYLLMNHACAQIRSWRSSVDEQLLLIEQRHAALSRDAEAARVQSTSELGSAIDDAKHNLRELEEKWPDWLATLRAEIATVGGTKAGAAEVDARLEGLEERLDGFGRQAGGTGGEVLELTQRMQRLERLEAEGAKIEARRGTEVAELASVLTKVSMHDQRSRSRHHSLPSLASHPSPPTPRACAFSPPLARR